MRKNLKMRNQIQKKRAKANKLKTFQVHFLVRWSRRSATFTVERRKAEWEGFRSHDRKTPKQR